MHAVANTRAEAQTIDITSVSFLWSICTQHWNWRSPCARCTFFILCLNKTSDAVNVSYSLTLSVETKPKQKYHIFTFHKTHLTRSIENVRPNVCPFTAAAAATTTKTLAMTFVRKTTKNKIILFQFFNFHFAFCVCRLERCFRSQIGIRRACRCLLASVPLTHHLFVHLVLCFFCLFLKNSLLQ